MRQEFLAGSIGGRRPEIRIAVGTDSNPQLAHRLAGEWSRLDSTRGQNGVTWPTWLPSSFGGDLASSIRQVILGRDLAGF